MEDLYFILLHYIAWEEEKKNISYSLIAFMFFFAVIFCWFCVHILYSEKNKSFFFVVQQQKENDRAINFLFFSSLAKSIVFNLLFLFCSVNCINLSFLIAFNFVYKGCVAIVNECDAIYFIMWFCKKNGNGRSYKMTL
jgi:hypothetical protein